jgi:hypothetical protein
MWHIQVSRPYITKDKILIVFIINLHIPNDSAPKASTNLIRSNFSTHAATFNAQSARKVTFTCLATDLKSRNAPSGDCGWIHSIQEWHVYKSEHKVGQLPTRARLTLSASAHRDFCVRGLRTATVWKQNAKHKLNSTKKQSRHFNNGASGTHSIVQGHYFLLQLKVAASCRPV